MFLRPVKDGTKGEKIAKHDRYDPVWITCDDLASEGILVRYSKPSPKTLDRLTSCQPCGEMPLFPRRKIIHFDCF